MKYSVNSRLRPPSSLFLYAQNFTTAASSFPRWYLQEKTVSGPSWGREGLLVSWGPTVSTAKIHGFTCGLFSPHGWGQATNPPPASSAEVSAQPSRVMDPLHLSELHLAPGSVLSPCPSLWWPHRNAPNLHVLPTSHAPHWGYMGNFWKCPLRVQTMQNRQDVERRR